MNTYHAKTLADIQRELGSRPEGLGASDVAERQAKFGFNELPEKKGTPPWLIFLKQFKSVLVYILFAAAFISLYFDHVLDFYVIISVVILNSIIGFVQEYRAQAAIGALKKLIVAHAKVWRDGELLNIPARELVPGDVISLEEGDRIPGDARLFEVKGFRTVESSLTGESLPVEKKLIDLPEKTTLADRINMVFMSTFVASGTAKAIVVGTGVNTAIGEIASSLENIVDEPSHFEKHTEELGKQMGVFAVVGATTMFIVGYYIRKMEFVEIFLFSVASLVSAIPEGLPAILTIVLAVGSHRMSKRKAIIRTLSTTETLGVTTTIITDKTGTLTENIMSANRIILGGGKDIRITGTGWAANGEFFDGATQIVPLENKDLDTLLKGAILSNNAKVVKNEAPVDGHGASGGFSVLGDPTEAALLVAAEKSGLSRSALESTNEKIDDLAFNSDAKFRATLVKNNDKKVIYAVGATEVIFNLATNVLVDGVVVPLDANRKKVLLNKMNELANLAMRVVALAVRDANKETSSIGPEDVTNLTILGLVGMMDPPRSEVKDAIKRARGAGIRVIMATGDHATTAVAIGKLIGLVSAQEEDSAHPLVLSESDLATMTPEQFKQAVLTTSIFARLNPLTKLKIAEVLQSEGEVVAMTGDGVNDAPALKKADIGIAMGITGTDVAREASRMVLADDNFATIVNAIEEGRIVFTNTRQSSYFLLTTHFAEMSTILVTMFFGLPLPLLTIHLLWLNLVTDGFNAIGLVSEPGHKDVLDEKPKNKDERILNRGVLPFMLLMTIIMAATTLFVFSRYYKTDINLARTFAFAIMSFMQFYNVLNLRSLKQSIFTLGFFSNGYAVLCLTISMILMLAVLYIPFLQNIFRFTTLSLSQFAFALGVSSSVLWAGEIYKFILRRISVK